MFYQKEDTNPNTIWTPNWRNKEPSSNILQHNINDAIAVLPKLQTGLDVNVRFTGVMELFVLKEETKSFQVADFEYTEDSLIFDLLDIRWMSSS